jgi:hypothetical protein
MDVFYVDFIIVCTINEKEFDMCKFDLSVLTAVVQRRNRKVFFVCTDYIQKIMTSILRENRQADKGVQIGVLRCL